MVASQKMREGLHGRVLRLLVLLLCRDLDFGGVHFESKWSNIYENWIVTKGGRKGKYQSSILAIPSS
jgi:hypothetical protein